MASCTANRSNDGVTGVDGHMLYILYQQSYKILWYWFICLKRSILLLLTTI